MDPFFGNHSWYNPPDPFRQSFSHYPRGGGVDSHPIQRPAAPKVVRIPVHFAGSEPVDRSGSALKIQKVFRGFLVRKSMRRIKDVKMQVDVIDEKLSKREEVELIRRDEKERLRMSESLMSLLFKLDSIRGVDLGVRDCRKSVIRKAIALQEKIDAIVAVDLLEDGEKVENEDSEVELRVSAETEIEDHEPEVGVSSKIDCSNQSVRMLDDSGNEFGDVASDGGGDSEIGNIVDVVVDSEVKVGEANSTEKNVHFVEESLIERNGKNEIGDWVEVEQGMEEKEETGHGCDDNNKRNNELMERMMEDNEKMMNMMTQLFDSNKKQMRMLTALSHRVEMLEKAFMCDKRRKTKKQKKNVASWGDE